MGIMIGIIMSKLVGMALVLGAGMLVAQEDWKRRILDDWEESKKLPRKKKKKRRKELRLDWTLANWEI